MLAAAEHEGGQDSRELVRRVDGSPIVVEDRRKPARERRSQCEADRPGIVDGIEGVDVVGICVSILVKREEPVLRGVEEVHQMAEQHLRFGGWLWVVERESAIWILTAII